MTQTKDTHGDIDTHNDTNHIHINKTQTRWSKDTTYTHDFTETMDQKVPYPIIPFVLNLNTVPK